MSRRLSVTAYSLGIMACITMIILIMDSPKDATADQEYIFAETPLIEGTIFIDGEAAPDVSIMVTSEELPLCNQAKSIKTNSAGQFSFPSEMRKAKIDATGHATLQPTVICVFKERSPKPITIYQLDHGQFEIDTLIHRQSKSVALSCDLTALKSILFPTTKSSDSGLDNVLSTAIIKADPQEICTLTYINAPSSSHAANVEDSTAQ